MKKWLPDNNCINYKRCCLLLVQYLPTLKNYEMMWNYKQGVLLKVSEGYWYNSKENQSESARATGVAVEIIMTKTIKP